jgi:hypothetical protein
VKLPWRKRRDDTGITTDQAGLERARAERALSEKRLETARRDVIRPLHEMRQKNHVAEMLDSLIERRAAQRRIE